MKRRRVVMIGDTQHVEFRAAADWLARHTDLQTAPCPDQELVSVFQPDVVVMAQSRPAQWTRAAIEQLHAAAPLARLIALLGTWCEGETRTGRVIPGLIR